MEGGGISLFPPEKEGGSGALSVRGEEKDSPDDAQFHFLFRSEPKSGIFSPSGGGNVLDPLLMGRPPPFFPSFPRPTGERLRALPLCTLFVGSGELS